MKKIIIVLALFISSILFFGENNDPNEKIIYDYYNLLCSPDTLKKAYDISPKKINFETFKNWYKNVAIAFVRNLKKNKDGTYSFRVYIGEYFGENSGKNEVSAYDVTMKVEGRKILDSTSKPVDMVIEYTLPYNNKTVYIVDDIKQNAVIIYLGDKNNMGKNILKKMKYDRFGMNIYSCKVLSDLLFMQFSSFDYMGSILFDLKTVKDIKLMFSKLYASSDNKYILSFGDDFMNGGGIALEIYNGKIIGKKIIGEDYIISDIQFFKKNKYDYIKFKTEDINQKKELKEVNLTEIVDNK